MTIFYIDHQDETKTGEENYQQRKLNPSSTAVEFMFPFAELSIHMKSLKLQHCNHQNKIRIEKNVHSLLKYI